MNLTAWLIATPLIASPVIYFAGRITARRPNIPVRADRACWSVSILVTVIVWALLIRAALDWAAGIPLSFTLGAVSLHIDAISLLFAGLALVIYTSVLVFSGAERIDGGEKYYAVLLLTTGSLFGLVCADDLFNLWAWFEAGLIASFTLVSFYGGRALAASIKYLLQSALGSLLIVLGIALVLARAGTLILAPPTPMVDTVPLALLAAGALFIVGFGIKSAFVPFHTWLPDVYADSTARVTALLSGAVTFSGVIALTRVLLPLANAAETWGILLIAFGLINTLAGNLLALRQTEIKRMLAYSGISHIGTIALALGIAAYAGLPDAAGAGMFQLIALGVMEALAFLAVGALTWGTGGAEDRRRGLSIRELRGLAHRFPLPGGALIVALLSLAGMPPLAGFIAKWQVFAAGFASPDPLIRGAIIFAALNILLALAYYLPILLTLMDSTPSDNSRCAVPPLMRAPLIALGAVTLVIGVFPDSLLWLTNAGGLP